MLLQQLREGEDGRNGSGSTEADRRCAGTVGVCAASTGRTSRGRLDSDAVRSSAICARGGQIAGSAGNPGGRRHSSGQSDRRVDGRDDAGRDNAGRDNAGRERSRVQAG